MTFLAVLHGLALIAVLLPGVQRRHLPWPTSLVALFLLGWANIVLTAQVLSLFSAMGVTWAYALTSIALGALTSLGLRALPPSAAVSGPAASTLGPPLVERGLFGFFAATWALAFIASLIIAFSFYPNNPDTLVYRFPRVYWYFAHGSLTHFSNVVDPRAVFYPFNGTLAYLPLLHYGLGARMFTAVSLLCWVVISATTYLFARNLGGARVAAAGTAWFVALTPNILIQALSTNDEIIAAAALLAGVFFLHRWFLGRHHFDLVLAVVGVLTSAGTKLHFSFYWPLVLLIGIVFLVHRKLVAAEIRRMMTPSGFSVLALSLFLAVALFGSFVIFNLQATGQAMEFNFAKQVLNSPFKLAVALQNIAIYASQIALSPIPDLTLLSGLGERNAAYVAFNQAMAPYFTWVDNGADFTSTYYRFTGITPAVAAFLTENSVMIGFVWIVAIIAGVRLAAYGRRDGLLWGRLHFASLPLWFLTYAASSRYIEGIPVYLAYAVIVAGPTFVYAGAPIANRWVSGARWATLAAVAATHCVFAVNILLYNEYRNLKAVFNGEPAPIYRVYSGDARVDSEISLAVHGVTDQTMGWGQPHWIFMMKNTKIRHFLNSYAAGVTTPAAVSFADGMLDFSRHELMPGPDDKTLHLYPVSEFPAYGFVPVHVTNKRSPGLSLIGSIQFTLGPEWVFAAGNDVDKRHDQHNYILLSFQEVNNFGRDQKPVVEVSPYLFGLGREDDLKFRYMMTIAGKVVDRSDWSTSPGAKLATPDLSADNGILTVEVRNDNAGGTVDRVDVPLRQASSLKLAEK